MLPNSSRQQQRVHDNPDNVSISIAPKRSMAIGSLPSIAKKYGETPPENVIEIIVDDSNPFSTQWTAEMVNKFMDASDSYANLSKRCASLYERYKKFTDGSSVASLVLGCIGAGAQLSTTFRDHNYVLMGISLAAGAAAIIPKIFNLYEKSRHYRCMEYTYTEASEAMAQEAMKNYDDATRTENPVGFAQEVSHRIHRAERGMTDIKSDEAVRHALHMRKQNAGGGGGGVRSGGAVSTTSAGP